MKGELQKAFGSFRVIPEINGSRYLRKRAYHNYLIFDIMPGVLHTRDK
jgi:hypothetical protein